MIKNLPILASTKTTSREKFDFDTDSRNWQLSRDVNVSLKWIDSQLSSDIKPFYISVLKFYAESSSAGHVANINRNFRLFCEYVKNGSNKLSLIKCTDLINYKSTLNKKNEYKLGVLRGFIYMWDEFDYPGIEDGVVRLLSGWRLRGNQKGLAVQTFDPEEGPLTKLEFEALHKAVIDGFQTGELDLADFVLAKLFITTGRRPSQIGDLKTKDLIEATSTDGLQEFLINIPRRKQRGVKWREEFKVFGLMPEIGVAVKALIDENRKRILQLVPDASQVLLGELPIFPCWDDFEKGLSLIPRNEMQASFESQMFHSVTKDLSKRFTNIIDRLAVESSRTGILEATPTRIRRTLATRAAKEGYGVLVIAELLDHSDTQNAGVYTANVPEHVYAINEAVGSQLAPLAGVFQGQIVDSEVDAIRGDDLTSRVRSPDGKAVGNCGQNGFCGGFGPIACYTCRDFQAWLDAPHEEVLAWLVADRERKLANTKDETIATINDRTIYAVGEVIKRCEQRKTELAMAVDHD